MAIYTDEEADRLIALYKLPAGNKAKWKFRQRIPDNLYDPNYQPKETKKRSGLDATEQIRQDRLQVVFSNPKWVIKRLGELAGLTETVVENFSAGKGSLTEAERQQLTKVIQQARVDIKNAIGEETSFSLLRMRRLFTVATDARIKKNVVFKSTNLAVKLTPSAIKKGSSFDKLSRSEYEEIIDGLSILLLETSLY